MPYAIIDIEATGGQVGTEKIIDIYIYRFNGETVEDQFGSMVNPERPIDFYVQKLTGITDKMVLRAPKFHELAKRIVEITEGCTIVGHGVDFDYRMLRQEFRELGFEFQRNTLDSLALSKKLLPDVESHSLGKLCKSLGIPIKSQHTAEGDTRATLELFKILLEKDKEKEIIHSFAIKDSKNRAHITKLISLEEELPDSMGVFYFLDKNRNVFYIGASRNIRKDVNQLFTSSGKTEKRMQSRVMKVKFELSGSFLIALLKQAEESRLLKNLMEPKAKQLHYGLFASTENNDFYIDKVSQIDEPALLLFNNKRKGYKAIHHLRSKLNLSEKTNIQEKVKKVKKEIDFPSKNLILIDKGRTKGEKSFIEIRNKKVIGYGFYTFHNQLENEEIRANIINSIKSNAKIIIILKTFLQYHPFQKIISFTLEEGVKIQNK